VQEGEELVRIATQKKLIGRVGYHNHYIGTFRLLKDLIKQNVLGEIFHFNGEAYGPVVVKDKTSTWRSKAEEGGGCLYDYASHVLNLVQEVLGWPERVGGTLLKSIYSKGVDDAVYASLRLKSGVTGTVSVNWSDETYRKMATSLTVVGKLGKIICDATEIKIYLKKPSPLFKLESGWTVKYITDLAIPVNFYLRGEEYSAQIDAFIDSITDPKKNDGLNTFEQALHTERVIHMLKEDANKNRLVA
jgi:predicted dehydrogenase